MKSLFLSLLVSATLVPLSAATLTHSYNLTTSLNDLFGGTALNFELSFRVMEVDNRAQIESDLRQEIERRFRQAGIEIP